jgi:predicted phosphodiesterase
MPKIISDDEFLSLWDRYKSVVEISRITGLGARGINKRRRNIEERTGIKLLSISTKSPDFQVTYPQNGIRANLTIKDGVIMVASDCHYYPNTISTAHRAFVKIIKELKPKMVVMNGDVFDGSSISRHPKMNWKSLPTVKQELEACQDRLGEVEKAAKGAKLHWTWGNHDLRFNARLVQQVEGFEGINGFNLAEHFPFWKFSTSLMINDNTMIKHRYHNGIHAAYNNALKSGISIITGHLHSLKITPWSDYKGSRYGVDTGTLADIDGEHMDYGEDNPKNHRSGFAVLTFYKGKLMPPELCEVISENDGLAYFRGKVIEV